MNGQVTAKPGNATAGKNPAPQRAEGKVKRGGQDRMAGHSKITQKMLVYIEPRIKIIACAGDNAYFGLETVASKETVEWRLLNFLADGADPAAVVFKASNGAGETKTYGIEEMARSLRMDKLSECLIPSRNGEK